MFWRRTAIRQRVLVNLSNNTTFNAILWRRNGPLLVLRDATFMEPGREPVKVDGEVVVENARVLWMQVLGGETNWRL